MPDIRAIPWVELFNVTWPSKKIYDQAAADAFQASVAAMVHDFRPGDIAEALQTLADRQRRKEQGCWEGTPTPGAVASQIIRIRHDRNRPPDEQCYGRSDTRLMEAKLAIQSASTHRERWDIMCDAGDRQRGGTVHDCIELHRWLCQMWRDFPVDVMSCRRAFEGGRPVLPAGMPF